LLDYFNIVINKKYFGINKYGSLTYVNSQGLFENHIEYGDAILFCNAKIFLDIG